MNIQKHLLYITLLGAPILMTQVHGQTNTQATKDIANFTSTMTLHPGYFNFWTDEKTGHIFLKVDKINQEFLYYKALASGVGNGGIEKGSAKTSIAKFIKEGPKLLLQLNNYGVRASANEAEDNAVHSVFASSIVGSFPIVSSDASGALVDITDFLLSDNLHLSNVIGTARASAYPTYGSATNGFKLDNTRSSIVFENTKNFPKNTEFEALLTFSGNATISNTYGLSVNTDLAPDPASISIIMHQSFVELPDNQYKMRKFDIRSGFIPFGYYDFSADMNQPLLPKFISRHRLAKKDPTATISEPVEPIIYYIDRGAPEKIKKALIEGGSWWNQAFEAAGYKNAFIVKELPADADPMDMRYNVVNWIDRTGNPTRAFSYGSSYMDPRTGEILKGVVTLGSDRHRQDYLIAEGLLQPYEKGKPVSDEMEKMALARIRQLSAHEIGHTLGLFHNFTASTKNRASVMDYPFPNIQFNADSSINLSDAYAKGIGEWDKRAIIWGYQDFPASTNENIALDTIMKSTLQQGFIFIPDIGGMVHPSSHQWDDGKDPIAQLDRLMKIRQHVLNQFSEKAIPENAPMATIEEVLVPIYLLHRYQVEAVSKFIGGQYFTHAVKYDGQIVTQMIDPQLQKQALKSLLNTIQPSALKLQENLIAKIPPRPSGYPSSIELFSRHTDATFDPIAAAEAAAYLTISYLLDPAKAARLIEYNARDAQYPSLNSVLNTIISKTIKNKIPSGYEGSIQVAINSLTLKALLALAANKNSSDNVKSETLLIIEELKDWLSIPASLHNVNYLYLFALIERFERDQNTVKDFVFPVLPPGAPI